MQYLKDITIIGAGPTGLFGCFYAGMRGASCRVIDNLDQAGGQLTALYPEKYIFDVAGFPKVLAKDLVKGMAEQALQFKSPLHLGQKVAGLRREAQNGAPLFTVVTDRDEYPSRTVLIAAGKMELRTFWEVKAIHGSDVIERVTIVNNKTKHEETVSIDCVLPQLGFISSLGAIAEWGLDIEKGEIKVSHIMETSIPGIFAAGDIVTYPGKLKLIATGAAEAAIAVNHAVQIGRAHV